MTIVRHLIIPAVLAFATGCIRGQHAAVSDSVNATPNAQPETPSAALTVTERGIGQLQAGMSVADASAAVGGALSMVEAGRIARVDVDSAGIATITGAQVGDTEERILGLYSTRAKVGPQKYEDGHYVTVRDAVDSTFALAFETVDGRVTRYRAGHRPQVEYVEGCS